MYIHVERCKYAIYPFTFIISCCLHVFFSLFPNIYFSNRRLRQYMLFINIWFIKGFIFRLFPNIDFSNRRLRQYMLFINIWFTKGFIFRLFHLLDYLFCQQAPAAINTEMNFQDDLPINIWLTKTHTPQIVTNIQLHITFRYSII